MLNLILKIFWRIFMRQISLTDYFYKGLIQTTGIYLLQNESRYTKGRLKISDDLL